MTGLAFISANLGAVEIVGMSANGAQFGVATMHYFWIGAVPAMIFLGVVMMPFYYGSKVRSVPEYMRRQFGTGAHLVSALSFAVAQVLIAGINLYLLAAGAFDVRNVIAALIGFYGIVLVVGGLVDNGDEALEKTDGFNANLWVGLAMVVFALTFALWSRLRPIVVATSETRDDGEESFAAG